MVDSLYNIIFNEERNVYLTGMAGTGKTFLLNKIYKIYYERNYNASINDILMTSTTGCSAIGLYNGRTLHSTLKIGIGESSVNYIVRMIMKDRNARKRWNLVKLLVIDECSMLDSELFDKLNEIGQMVRKNKKVFGGIKMLLVGDMLQLPPVSNKGFIFESKTWNMLNIYRFKLSAPKRFTDIKFFEMLSRIRYGKIIKKDIKKLKERREAYKNEEHKISDIIPTILFPKKNDVHEYNVKELNKLEGETYAFNSQDKVFKRIEKEGEISEISEIEDEIDENDNMIFNNISDKRIVLKIGAQVMLTKNISVEEKLINGSRGIIRDITCMGEIEVEFCDGIKKRIGKKEYDIIIENKRYQRKQIPLILAWAVSIHKSQSATIDSVVVDLGPDIFATGQGYVALSRVRNLKGLYLSNFTPSSIIASEKAIKFESE